MKHPWSSQRFREGARAEGRSEGVIAAAAAAADAIKRTNSDLPVILTLGHLAHLAGVPIDALQVIAFRKEDPYRVFRIKKRGTPNGVAAPPRGYRTICVPHRDLMRAQRWIAQNILNAVPSHPVSYAFAPRRDLVGAAERHVEAKWLVKMDVRHFFELIPERRVYHLFRSLGYGALLSFQMARVCTRLPHHHARNVRLPEGRGNTGLPYRRHRQGHLPQGAPTSPMLANLVMWPLDHRIDTLAARGGWAYTRYADDLAFSRRTASTRGEAMHLAKAVEHELVQFGLVNNREKTTIIPPGARKLLLGVLVDRERPRLTREFRDNVETHLFALANPKIGAAAHRAKRGFASIIGMRRHIEGLIAFAHQVDKKYGATLYSRLNAVDWNK